MASGSTHKFVVLLATRQLSHLPPEPTAIRPSFTDSFASSQIVSVSRLRMMHKRRPYTKNREDAMSEEVAGFSVP